LGITGGMAGPNANALLRELGAGWLRMPLNWAQFDTVEKRLKTKAWVDGLYASVSNIKLLVTVRAWRGGLQPTPPDIQAYCTDLRALRDAILADAWQVENEIDSPFWWGGTIAEYAELLSAAYEILHSPGVLVLCAGLTSEATTKAWQYSLGQIELPDSALALMQKCQRLVQGGRYDVADIHVYDLASTAKDRVAWFASKTNGRPVWVTECGGPDIRVVPYSEEAQVYDLQERMRGILAVAQKAFWLGLYESQEQGEVYNHLGLVALVGRRKPAFAVYQGLM